jgi:hypothetical protein
MNLCNPGKERIRAFTNDVDQKRKHAPLNNFTTSNLMAEGMLTAKSLFPHEFEAYEFDEVQYLRSTMRELSRRRSLGVEVTVETDDALRYAIKYPALVEELQRLIEQGPLDRTNPLLQSFRSLARKLGLSTLRRRAHAYRLGQKLAQGAAHSGFSASGDDFGFTNVLGCAEFLNMLLNRTWLDVQAPGTVTTTADTLPPGKRSVTSAASASLAARE